MAWLYHFYMPGRRLKALHNIFPSSFFAPFRCAAIVWLSLLPFVSEAQKIVEIKVSGGITPATAEYIQRGVEKAEKDKAQCLLVHLNTPGGLMNATRDIVSSIMESHVPVVVYIGPSGAHAGSAGVFITLAADMAAMAPGTNIGAAHPVDMQGKADGVMNEKITNDAAAFIRSIAEKRNRDVKWAEEAVRTSVAISEREALEKNIIDIIAVTRQDLLTRLDGREVVKKNKVYTLHTKEAEIESVEMGFFQKVLSRISNPDIAYILMMLGFYGLLFELFSPGSIFPGIVGVISLILAFYAMSSLPVNYAGLALIVFGIALFLLEIKVISHGMLGIGGTLSVLLGSMILFRNSPAENVVSLSWTVILSVTAFSALFFLFLVTMGLRAQRARQASGNKAFIGQPAIAMEALDPGGHVQFMGEIWNAVSRSGRVEKGEQVIVKESKDLTLFVEQAIG